jgi:hypothetical protein
MPNWTNNTITVSGSVDDTKQFEADRLAALKEFGCDPKQHITFNMVLPMPSELKGTTSPRRKTPDEIHQLAEQHNWDGKYLQWYLDNALTPEENERLNEIKARLGYDNWYDWCNDKWGTKWDACHSEYSKDGELVTIRFDTAWCEPQPVIRALVRKYPALRFHHSFFHEDSSDTITSIDYRMENGEMEASFSVETNRMDYLPIEEVDEMIRHL